MTTLAILIGIYIIAMPIVLRLIATAQKKLVVDRATQKAPKNRLAQKNLPTPLWNKIKKQVGFTMKDKRPTQINEKPLGVTNRILFLILWAIGPIIITTGYFTEIWWITLIGYLSFFISIIFGYNASKKLLQTRQKIIARMFEIAKAKLSLSVDYEDNPEAAIQVQEWQDYIKPQKVRFEVPTTFAATGEQGFLEQFNQVFGQETTWVPSYDDEDTGWDYEQGQLIIRTVPPLPQKADWSPHYIDNPAIAWSFFPIGIAVENGVELPNPETGEIENIVGFDFSGIQQKVGQKAGVKTAERITTSPMALIGGGTGGGKSCSADTPIKVFEKDENSTE